MAAAVSERGWSARSLGNMQGIHADLRRLLDAVLQRSPYDFVVLEGLRSRAQEEIEVSTGKSETHDSRHLFGLAIDFGVLVNGSVVWKPTSLYEQVANCFLAVAAELKIPITWGGSWATLKDLDHIELNRAYYPDPVNNGL